MTPAAAPGVAPNSGRLMLPDVDGFQEINREHWDDGQSVRSITSYERCREYFDETMKGFRLRIGVGQEEVQLAHRSLKMGSSQVDFVQLRCGRGFRVDQPDEFDYYYLKFVLSGSCELATGEDSIVVRQGEAAAVNPFGQLIARWSGVCEQVMIRIDRNTLEQTLADELDIRVTDPVRFAPICVTAETSRPVSALVDVLRRDADGARVFRTWRLGRQFERLVHLAALQCFPNNYSEPLRGARSMAAPYYVRKAEDYLRRHLREQITIEELARVAGVSTRALFWGFRRGRDTTPMAYLKKLRLDLARDTLLSAARTGASVTDVAMAVGFIHLSRFSSEYKARFGESPSATRSRGPLDLSKADF